MTNPNSQLEEGEYVGLFRESDAMIHDCTSFITEYLYTGKPALYLNPNIRDRLNEYGKLGYDAILKAHKQTDIEDFILSVIRGERMSIDDSLMDMLKPRTSPTISIMKILNKELIGW